MEMATSDSTGDSVLMVFTNCPDAQTAASLAEHLIESRLAACVNVLAACDSVYRWRGSVERAREVPVLIKTTRGAYDRLAAAIRSHHPYELPEIVAVRVEAGLPEYLNWVRSEIE